MTQLTKYRHEIGQCVRYIEQCYGYKPDNWITGTIEGYSTPEYAFVRVTNSDIPSWIGALWILNVNKLTPEHSK